MNSNYRTNPLSLKVLAQNAVEVQLTLFYSETSRSQPHIHTQTYRYRASQKKLPLYVLLNIFGTKEQNYKPFSPTENLNQCANFEYRTIFVRFKGLRYKQKKIGF